MVSVAGRASVRSLQAVTEDRTDAMQRTLMEADHSLMAWVRTSLAMVSFGFTIYKVLQGFADSMQTVFHVTAATMLLAFVGTWFIKEEPLREHSALQAPREEPAVL